MNFQVRPPSVDFHTPDDSGSGALLPLLPPRPPSTAAAAPSAALISALSGATSICAYTTFGLLRAISRATRPIVPLGSPLPVMRVQVSPPSAERQMPLPGPPPANPHDVRRRWYVAANNT